jgi:hypothetical protein
MIIHSESGKILSNKSIMFFNSALVEIVKLWESMLSLFVNSDSFSEKDLFKVMSSKRLVSFDSSMNLKMFASQRPQEKHREAAFSIIDLLQFEDERRIGEEGRTFLCYPNLYSHEEVKDQRLIAVSRKQIEFKGKNCDMVFITDKTFEYKCAMD